jgi:hypothetical protein
VRITLSEVPRIWDAMFKSNKDGSDWFLASRDRGKARGLPHHVAVAETWAFVRSVTPLIYIQVMEHQTNWARFNHPTDADVLYYQRAYMRKHGIKHVAEQDRGYEMRKHMRAASEHPEVKEFLSYTTTGKNRYKGILNESLEACTPRGTKITAEENAKYGDKRYYVSGYEAEAWNNFPIEERMSIIGLDAVPPADVTWLFAIQHPDAALEWAADEAIKWEGLHKEWMDAVDALQHPQSFRIGEVPFDEWLNSVARAKQALDGTFIEPDRHCVKCNSVLSWWTNGELCEICADKLMRGIKAPTVVSEHVDEYPPIFHNQLFTKSKTRLPYNPTVLVGREIVPVGEPDTFYQTHVRVLELHIEHVDMSINKTHNSVGAIYNIPWFTYHTTTNLFGVAHAMSLVEGETYAVGGYADHYMLMLIAKHKADAEYNRA